MTRPTYARAHLTDRAIEADTSGELKDAVDHGHLQDASRRTVFISVRRNLRRRQTEAAKADAKWPYQIKMGDIAKSLRVTPEEVAEAILGWGYWVFFHRDVSKPVAEWIVDEEGE